MEIGLFDGVGGSFRATVKNSVIEDSNSCGIQVLDQGDTGGSTFDVTLQDNLMIGNGIGVCGTAAHSAI